MLHHLRQCLVCYPTSTIAIYATPPQPGPCMLYHLSQCDVCFTTSAMAVHALPPQPLPAVPPQAVSYMRYHLPRNGELRTQKLKSHLVRIQSLNVLPFKPGVGQYIAIHATLTAGDFFLAYFYTSGPFTCIFFKNLSRFFPVLALANTWFLCRPAE